MGEGCSGLRLWPRKLLLTYWIFGVKGLSLGLGFMVWGLGLWMALSLGVRAHGF